MDITRRSAFKGLLAASALPLFNIGCAGFGDEFFLRRLRRGDYSVSLCLCVGDYLFSLIGHFFFHFRNFFIHNLFERVSGGC